MTHITYLLLSPTFGMHQYTADLANRVAGTGSPVHLVSTSRLPRDRYHSQVQIQTPVHTSGTGFSAEGLDWSQLRRVEEAVLSTDPDLVHLSGPHLWNTPLMARLQRRGIPAVHTIHDLDPHRGVSNRLLIRLWNRLVVRQADHVLVHGHRYLQRLVERGVAAEKVTHIPLLHLFLGATFLSDQPHDAGDVSYEPFVLFFGRLEEYKGLDTLLSAASMLPDGAGHSPQVVVAGAGNIQKLWRGGVPSQISLYAEQIEDGVALDLFRRCRALVLPYSDATQSALVAAGYFFRKPVLATHTGALSEYVQHGGTGFLVEPNHPVSMSRHLQQLLSNEKLAQEMGERGHLWYTAKRQAEFQTLQQMYGRLTYEHTEQPGRIDLPPAFPGPNKT